MSGKILIKRNELEGIKSDFIRYAEKLESYNEPIRKIKLKYSNYLCYRNVVNSCDDIISQIRVTENFIEDIVSYIDKTINQSEDIQIMLEKDIMKSLSGVGDMNEYIGNVMASVVPSKMLLDRFKYKAHLKVVIENGKRYIRVLGKEGNFYRLEKGILGRNYSLDRIEFLAKTDPNKLTKAQLSLAEYYIPKIAAKESIKGLKDFNLVKAKGLDKINCIGNIAAVIGGVIALKEDIDEAKDSGKTGVELVGAGTASVVTTASGVVASTTTGAYAGAVIGAAIGSIAPGPGTAVGALSGIVVGTIVGVAIDAFSEWEIIPTKDGNKSVEDLLADGVTGLINGIGKVGKGISKGILNISSNFNYNSVGSASRVSGKVIQGII